MYLNWINLISKPKKSLSSIMAVFALQATFEDKTKNIEEISGTFGIAVNGKDKESNEKVTCAHISASHSSLKSKDS